MGSKFYSIDPYVYLILISHYFDYCSLIVRFNIGCENLQVFFFSFFQYQLAIQAPLVLYEFEDQLFNF